MRHARAHAVASLVLALVASACGGGGGDAPEADANPLLNPRAEVMNRTAPDTFQVLFETSRGDFTVEVRRDWAPNGADRFYNLVSNGFYDGVRFFRVIEGFMAQFGLHGDPQVTARWRAAPIPDDPVVASNTRGTITFAMTSQPNSRTTQLFINYGDNTNLDASGFAPIGEVVSGMDVVDQLYSEYGEGAPNGTGPYQAQVVAEGNAYLQRDFPNLDYVERAAIVQ